MKIVSSSSFMVFEFFDNWQLFHRIKIKYFTCSFIMSQPLQNSFLKYQIFLCRNKPGNKIASCNGLFSKRGG